MKYKVGDKVRIKSLDWYNENKNKYGEINVGNGYWNKQIKDFCSSIMTIYHIVDNKWYMMEETFETAIWTDEMIEGLVEEPILSAPNITDGIFISEKDMKWTTEYLLPDGYIFKDENGNVINATKIVLEKKKKEYPKTYEECRDYIESCYDEPFCADLIATGYKSKLIESFARLLICRDAYWKIAGEEMGLGKPWKPDWNGKLYYLYYNPTNTTGVVRGFTSDGVLAYIVLAFPTEEMRDAFYENFKELIEICKELL